MIRRSALVATATLALSLLAHVLGIGLTVRVEPEDAQDGNTPDIVALGNAFEDIAEPLAEPVEPEETPAPEPPDEAPPEPELADIPTSQALVASPNPQATTSPGTGPAGEVQPVEAETPAPAQTAAVEPETVETQQSSAAQPPADPVQPAPASEAEADATADQPPRTPSDTIAPEPGISERVAALPVESVPTLPVPPAPAPTAIPVVPSDVAPIDPAIPEAAVEAVPEDTDATSTVDEFGGTRLAVNASPRPPPRSLRAFETSEGDADGGPPPLMMSESPLVAYARDGNLSGWTGRGGSGSGGNASVTNYAGRVLVHLNNAPRVEANARGAARVVFVINPDGSLASVDVVQSSGTFQLDNAAKAQVRRASPFPPPPQGRSRRLSFIYRSR